ncbi:uncharacterized protein LOC134276174 [Saccostrea cucullata]|uniref:uncharacterized protein LOC134276174 n=1 Tax=Saccostrea cuccullata TaxID=36930 RepID=UPI002ED65316
MDFALENAQQFWRQQSLIDAVKNRERRYQQGRGACNIFILDTSSNVGEEGFIQMKETFCTIMDEYAKSRMDENVAVVICGRTTTFKHHYSNKYNRLKCCIDDVEYGGPCPLTAAFILSEGAILNGAGYSKMMGHFHIHPRLIVISAGRPTDFTSMIDTGDRFIRRSAEVRDHLHQTARNIGRVHPIYCIPVGHNPDMANLEFMSAHSRGGKIILSHQAKQFAKLTENMNAAALITFSTTLDNLDKRAIEDLMSQVMPEREFTKMDKEDIFDICSLKSVFISMDEIQAENDNHEMEMHAPNLDPNMPPLGSRVKRGPDWMWKNQDRHGPGTVIAPSKDAGWLIVRWDAGTADGYRYGTNTVLKDKYDVVVCTEPRILNNELIAVGCLVQRGWYSDDQDGGIGKIGAVYKVNPNGVVQVNWSNGSRGSYKYGAEGEFELTLCDPFSLEVRRYLQEQRTCAASKLPNTLQYVYCNSSSEAQNSVSTKNRGRLKTKKRLAKFCYLKHQKANILRMTRWMNQI